jgi:Uncharacterised nucleotidyltransferase
MTPGETKISSVRIGALMWNLRIDAATGEFVSALRERAIESIVLKGPTLADWYPPDSGRMYSDGDVWVAPGDLTVAEEVLAELGFAPTRDDTGLPTWWQEHGSSWQRERDLGKIDLHRFLQGTKADPQRVWELLRERSLPFRVGGVDALRLDTAAQALYVTLHGTHHGRDDPRGLPHLLAALTSLGDLTWQEATDLAVELDALDAFGTGLRLLPAGVELARRIGVPGSSSVRSMLYASTPPPVALGFDQIASARGVRRLTILLRKLFPPAGFVRHWWPPAKRNRLMLSVGYGYRPLWLLLRAPRGYLAWRAAKRQARALG